MKSILYTAAGALLIFSSCSTAYKSAQTPDDVYYSPKTERTYASSNNNNRQNQDQGQTNVAAADEQDGSYVTYDDEDRGDYAKRLDRFHNSSYNGAYYADGTPNVYVNNYYGGGYGGYGGFGYSPYSYWGGGFGSPYFGSMWGPSLSIGFGYGWGGGFGYSPFYSPFYSPWYSPYYGGYYGGGYYGGGWGHYPSAYYSAPSRVLRTRGGFAGSTYSPGRRVIGSTNTGTGDYRPRRIFTTPNNGSGGSTGGTYQPRRIFRSAPSERPMVNPGNNGGSAPRRIFSSPSNNSSAPQRTFSAPQRTFSAPSSTPSSGGSRSSGGGGGGGGRTFRGRN